MINSIIYCKTNRSSNQYRQKIHSTFTHLLKFYKLPQFYNEVFGAMYGHFSLMQFSRDACGSVYFKTSCRRVLHSKLSVLFSYTHSIYLQLFVF